MKINGAQAFSVFIRIVFLFAFGAFLTASIHHIAAFFGDYEPSQVGPQSYALAISIDGTALVLTIGVMFFADRMPWYAKGFVWFFIIGLTAFSWVVNWQYAVAFQNPNGFTSKLDPVWQSINPILASSFAFLNLAYSLVSEFFSAKKKTAVELQAELDALNETGEIERKLREKKAEISGPGFIQIVKEKAKEIKSAASEVLADENASVPPQKPDQNLQQNLASKTMESKLKMTLDFLAKTPAASDEKLAEILQLDSPAKAHYWRLKSESFLQQNLNEKEEEDFSQLFEQETSSTPSEKTTGKLPENYGSDTARNTDEIPQVPSKKAPQKKTQKSNKTGLTFSAAARLECCQKKGIKSSDIRAAVLAQKLRRFSDGSVSRNAVEKWAKSYVVSSVETA